jgi:hypothetical protein
VRSWREREREVIRNKKNREERRKRGANIEGRRYKKVPLSLSVVSPYVPHSR